jgi:hypothetical protein
MSAVRRVAILVIVLMSALGANIVINDSLANGLGFDVFLAGAGSPWQLFINNDLVSGLLFAVTWIIYRERGNRAMDTITWVWMALWWGNIMVAAYVLVALRQAAGDDARFFLGKRAGALAQVWPAPSRVSKILLLLIAAVIIAYLGMLLVSARNAVAAIGSFLGFAPIALSLALLALPSTSGGDSREREAQPR